MDYHTKLKNLIRGCLNYVDFKQQQCLTELVNLSLGKLSLYVILMCVSLGCAGFPQISGKLLVTTAQSADGAMRGWAMYVVAGGANATQEAQVRSIYSKYQASMAVATNAYIAACVSKTNLSSWNTASAAIQASSGSLLQLISVFENHNLASATNKP